LFEVAFGHSDAAFSRWEYSDLGSRQSFGHLCSLNDGTGI